VASKSAIVPAYIHVSFGTKESATDVAAANDVVLSNINKDAIIGKKRFFIITHNTSFFILYHTGVQNARA